jgi:OmcA/MtrC family decaheme c-type cytochrome
MHQAIYNQYKDASAFTVTIEEVTSTPEAGTDPVTYTSVMKFKIQKSGVPYVDAGLAGLDQKKYSAYTYDSATRKYNAYFDYGTPTLVDAATGLYSVTKTAAAFAPEQTNAQVYAYVVDDKLVSEGMQLYSNVTNVGKTYGDANAYVSAANVAGCERCHGTPYMKHGYRMAAVSGLPDFAGCKACHIDSRDGGHQGWQLLVDDPAAYAAQGGVLTAEQKTKYAYKRSVMNDVHMSHAMEFAYPQSMANCVTCHDGKLGAILTDANFNLTTCKSCHPMTAAETSSKRAPSLASRIQASPLDLIHTWDLGDPATASVACNTCHKAGGVARMFNQIHTGYNKTIYPAADGKKYSDYFSVAINEASFDAATNVLTVKFAGTETGDLPGLAVSNITPTVMVGLYGYDTKDFIVSAHGSVSGVRNLEWVYGTTHKRFTGSFADGVWTVTVNLSDWKDMMTAGKVKRAELVVMPKLLNAAGATVALNAATKTFDLTKNAIDATYFKAIVDPAKCNKCHEALATTFHSGDRGGSVVTCRTCHTVREGGGHLEMQSRSIDSYVHAIHSFQAFDIKNVDFADAVQKMEYEHHTESTYPNFTIFNCESCHNAGTYNIPDQTKSMPGVLSASAVTKNWDRAVGTYPSYVTGPASRACGACHRADKINEDDAAGLASFFAHTGAFSTQLVANTGVYDAAIEKIMAEFK